MAIGMEHLLLAMAQQRLEQDRAWARRQHLLAGSGATVPMRARIAGALHRLAERIESRSLAGRELHG